MQQTPHVDIDHAEAWRARERFLFGHQQRLKALAKEWMESATGETSDARFKEPTSADIQNTFVKLQTLASSHREDLRGGPIIEDAVGRFILQTQSLFLGDTPGHWLDVAKPAAQTLFYLTLLEVRDRVRDYESVLDKVLFVVSHQRSAQPSDMAGRRRRIRVRADRPSFER